MKALIWLNQLSIMSTPSPFFFLSPLSIPPYLQSLSTRRQGATGTEYNMGSAWTSHSTCLSLCLHLQKELVGLDNPQGTAEFSSLQFGDSPIQLLATSGPQSCHG